LRVNSVLQNAQPSGAQGKNMEAAPVLYPRPFISEGTLEISDHLINSFQLQPEAAWVSSYGPLGVTAAVKLYYQSPLAPVLAGPSERVVAFCSRRICPFFRTLATHATMPALLEDERAREGCVLMDALRSAMVPVQAI